MNFTCRKESFLETLSLVSRIPSRHPSLPILSHVLIEVTEGTLTVSATNLDIGVTASTDVVSEENGVIAVLPGPVMGFLSNLPTGEKIQGRVDDNKLVLESKASSARVLLSSYDDFPNLPQTGDTPVFKISSKELVRGFESVIFAAASSNIKPELSSVYVASEGSTGVFVATDGFRLAEKKIDNSNFSISHPFLLPAKNALEITRMLPENEEVNVSVGDNTLSLSTQKLYLVSRLVEGTYPDYKQLLTGEAQVKAVVSSDDFSRALKASSVFVDTFRKIKIEVSEKDQTLTVESQNTDIGENKVTIPAKTTGDHTQNFNERYLAEPLSIISQKNLSFSFGGGGRPLIIQGEGDTSYIYLVMPMNR